MSTGHNKRRMRWWRLPCLVARPCTSFPSLYFTSFHRGAIVHSHRFFWRIFQYRLGDWLLLFHCFLLQTVIVPAPTIDCLTWYIRSNLAFSIPITRYGSDYTFLISFKLFVSNFGLFHRRQTTCALSQQRSWHLLFVRIAIPLVFFLPVNPQVHYYLRHQRPSQRVQWWTEMRLPLGSDLNSIAFRNISTNQQDYLATSKSYLSYTFSFLWSILWSTFMFWFTAHRYTRDRIQSFVSGRWWGRL